MMVRTWLIPMAALVAVVGCKKKTVETVVYQSVPVERRNIVVSAQANGTIQPDTVVEVKSKASGEILEMKVETGEQVRRGQLLVRVDQRSPRNEVNLSEAALAVA